MPVNFTYSLEKDAENYRDYVYQFNSPTFGVTDIKEKIVAKLHPDLKVIIRDSKDENEAYSRVLEFLTKYYNDPVNKFQIDSAISNLQKEWEKAGNQIIYDLETIYKQPFPFDGVTGYITTSVICPYNYTDKYFYIPLNASTLSRLRIAEHELNHFMFYYYFPELKEKLGNDKYELLKESITFFSNPEDEGKPDEKPLRELYLSKKWANLKEAIESAVNIL